jgi:hypothetical protein
MSIKTIAVVDEDKRGCFWGLADSIRKPPVAVDGARYQPNM